MQGLPYWIPTHAKARLLNALLRVGFDSLDFGSFVSPRAIPQMQDTAQLVKMLDKSGSNTRLLAIVGNARGAREAASFEAIDDLGFPFSISEIFLQRNINSNIEQSINTTAEILEICQKNNKRAVVYISMAFGNPYGEDYSPEQVAFWSEKLVAMGVEVISLADTIGTANPKIISDLFAELKPRFERVELGLHLHARPDDWHGKVAAAFQHGCRRFDSVINGLGGCPMAKDELVGNLKTSYLIDFARHHHLDLGLDENSYHAAESTAAQTFTDLGLNWGY